MNRLELFSQSLSILWRHKSLWLFGFLAALGGGGLNSLMSLTNFNSLQSSMNMSLGVSPESFRAWLGLNFAQTIISDLLLGLVSFFVLTYAESALIAMVNTIGTGETPSIGDGASTGFRRFIPLLAVKVLLALPILIVGGLLTGSFVTILFGAIDRNQTPPLAFNPGAMLGLVILVNILNVLSLGVGISAKRAIVLENIPITTAIIRGWRLMWAKFNDYFVIAVLLVLFGLLFSALIYVALVPSLMSLKNPFSAVTIVIIVFNVLLDSFASIFISSIWTLAYCKWQGTSNHTLLKPVTVE